MEYCAPGPTRVFTTPPPLPREPDCFLPAIGPAGPPKRCMSPCNKEGEAVVPALVDDLRPISLQVSMSAKTLDGSNRSVRLKEG